MRVSLFVFSIRASQKEMTQNSARDISASENSWHEEDV